MIFMFSTYSARNDINRLCLFVLVAKFNHSTVLLSRQVLRCKAKPIKFGQFHKLHDEHNKPEICLDMCMLCVPSVCQDVVYVVPNQKFSEKIFQCQMEMIRSRYFKAFRYTKRTKYVTNDVLLSMQMC